MLLLSVRCRARQIFDSHCVVERGPSHLPICKTKTTLAFIPNQPPHRRRQVIAEIISSPDYTIFALSLGKIKKFLWRPVLVPSARMLFPAKLFLAQGHRTAISYSVRRISMDQIRLSPIHQPLDRINAGAVPA
ncbi:MAG: hypothetical protein EBT12_01195, partial [Marivivens sp.]|nr:hypothetical protein [Marivivens sp.]